MIFQALFSSFQNLQSQYYRQSYGRSAESKFIETNSTVNSTRTGFLSLLTRVKRAGHKNRTSVLSNFVDNVIED